MLCRIQRSRRIISYTISVDRVTELGGAQSSLQAILVRSDWGLRRCVLGFFIGAKSPGRKNEDIIQESKIRLYTNVYQQFYAPTVLPLSKKISHWFCMDLTTSLDPNRGPGLLCHQCDFVNANNQINSMIGVAMV